VHTSEGIGQYMTVVPHTLFLMVAFYTV